MSGDCEDVALELLVAALAALVGDLPPRRQIAFVQRMSEELERPITVQEAHRVGNKAAAKMIWGGLAVKLLKP